MFGWDIWVCQNKVLSGDEYEMLQRAIFILKMEMLLIVPVGSEALTWSRCSQRAVLRKSLPEHRTWNQIQIRWWQQTVIQRWKHSAKSAFIFIYSFIFAYSFWSVQSLWFEHSWPPEDWYSWLWWSSDFSSCTTMRLTFVSLIEVYHQLLNKLSWNWYTCSPQNELQ